MRARRLGPSRDAAAERLFVPAEHEKQEAEPVEPPAYLGVLQAACPLERHAAAFRAARDRAGEIERSGGGRRAGEDEAVRHCYHEFELGNQRIEPPYCLLGRVGERRAGRRVRGQLSTQRVEPPLNLLADRSNPLVRAERLRETNRARSLVDGAVSLDSRIILAGPTSTEQP